MQAHKVELFLVSRQGMGLATMQGSVLPNLIISAPSLQPRWATATTSCSGMHQHLISSCLTLPCLF